MGANFPNKPAKLSELVLRNDSDRAMENSEMRLNSISSQVSHKYF